MTIVQCAVNVHCRLADSFRKQFSICRLPLCDSNQSKNEIWFFFFFFFFDSFVADGMNGIIKCPIAINSSYTQRRSQIYQLYISVACVFGSTLTNWIRRNRSIDWDWATTRRPTSPSNSIKCLYLYVFAFWCECRDWTPPILVRTF